MRLFVCALALSALSAWAQDAPKGKVIYKYKKYQKFDFEDLVVEGDSGSFGDITSTGRFQRKFKNKLPYRRNFNPEMVRSVERVR